VCDARCEVLAAHGAGSGVHEDKQIRRCRAPIVGFAAARPFHGMWESHRNMNSHDLSMPVKAVDVCARQDKGLSKGTIQQK